MAPNRFRETSGTGTAGAEQFSKSETSAPHDCKRQNSGGFWDLAKIHARLGFGRDAAASLPLRVKDP